MTILQFPQRYAGASSGVCVPGGGRSLPRRAAIPPVGEPRNHAEEIALTIWKIQQEQEQWLIY